SPALTQKVFANMKRAGKVDAAVEDNVPEDVAHDAIPSPPSHDIPSPSQEPSLHPQQQHSSPQAPPHDVEFPTQLQQVLNARVKKLEKANMVKSLKIRRLRKVEASRQVESSDDIEDVFNQGMIDDMDKDEEIELENDSEVQEVVEVVTTAKIITEVVTATASQVSAASATIPVAKPKKELPLKTLAGTPKVKDKGKGILVENPKPMKKKDQIELDAEYAKKLHEEINKDYEEFNKDIDWDAVMDHKAAKRRKLSEEAQEAEDRRKHLEVVEDEDDDVFVDATSLASKVPVVD
nr:hypothetical protein [Tanacetum cinerariifolium]